MNAPAQTWSWPSSNPARDLAECVAHIRRVQQEHPRCERARLSRELFDACSLSALRREVVVLDVVEPDGQIFTVDMRLTHRLPKKQNGQSTTTSRF